MKSENAARIAVEVRGRGNEVKGCKGIPSLFSTVNHSAGARDTKEPVCVCGGVGCAFEWCDRSST